MKIAIISSDKDPAGMNIASFLKPKKYRDCQTELFTIHEHTVHAEKLDEHLPKKADLLLFITKHESQSKIPSFCVHTQGNWSKAQLGGNERELTMCPVVLKNKLYREMRNIETDFDIVHEATHHGPSVSIPSVFIEIGSTKTEWEDPNNGELIANVIDKVLTRYKGETSSKTPVFVGIGGNHTCANFNNLSANGDILLSHVIPNYEIDNATADIIEQAIQKTTLPARVLVDKKALKSEQFKRITEFLDEKHIESVRLKDFKKILLTSR